MSLGLTLGADGTYQNKVTKAITNPTLGLFHEMGHVIYDGQDQTQVITFDNMIRGIQKTQQSDGSYKSTPIPARPDVDMTHSPATIQVQY